MISVDISNIWCTVSLPDLLQSEKSIFDAHMQLSGEKPQNAWLSWLEPSESARRTWVNPVVTAAEKIRTNAEILVVVGGGLPAMAAQAAIRLAVARDSSLQLLFVGDDLSTDKWLRVVQMLENKDFSVLATASCCSETAALITLRSLRWIMEKRYAERTKERIFVCAGARTAMYRMAEASGYTLLPMPEAPGAEASALNPAAMLIMAVAGIRPSLFFSGAAEMAQRSDIRSFDNPVWLYAAARTILKEQGLCCETVCTPGPDAEALGAWWHRVMAAACNKNGRSIFLQHMKLPGDFYTMGDALLQPGHFASLLRFPLTKKKVAVEMDWKDADGLNGLVGQDLRTIESKTLSAIADTCTELEVPFITIECDEELTDDRLGELFCFFEMSAGLSAHAMGVTPTARPHAPGVLRELDSALGRNSANV